MKPIFFYREREDLKKIHRNFTALSETISQKMNRFKYFIASCSYFSQRENFDFVIALKLRPS